MSPRRDKNGRFASEPDPAADYGDAYQRGEAMVDYFRRLAGGDRLPSMAADMVKLDEGLRAGAFVSRPAELRGLLDELPGAADPYSDDVTDDDRGLHLRVIWTAAVRATLVALDQGHRIPVPLTQLIALDAKLAGKAIPMPESVEEMVEWIRRGRDELASDHEPTGPPTAADVLGADA